MKIILMSDVDNLGSLGDELNVKPGYARNYLIPKGYAKKITNKNTKEINHYRKIMYKKRFSAIEKAQELAEKIKGIELLFKVKVGEKEKLFGSVTTKNVIEFLSEKGIEFDKKAIQSFKPIKTLGVHNILFKLHSEVSINLKIKVVPDSIEKEVKEKIVDEVNDGNSENLEEKVEN